MLDGIKDWFILYPFFGTMLMMMGLDVLLGVILSVQTKQLSSDVSRRGMTRKVVMVTLVLASDFLGKATGMSGAREASSLFFTMSELISVVENAVLLGAPIPPALTAILIQLRQQTGEGQQFRLGDSPAEHTRILTERETARRLADPITDAVTRIEKGDML